MCVYFSFYSVQAIIQRVMIMTKTKMNSEKKTKIKYKGLRDMQIDIRLNVLMSSEREMINRTRPP